MFEQLKPLLDAAKKFVADAIADRIEDAEQTIVREQRRIKRLKAQRTLSEKFLTEMAKPPKPFKMPKLSKRQLKARAKAMADAGFLPMMPARPAVNQ